MRICGYATLRSSSDMAADGAGASSAHAATTLITGSRSLRVRLALALTRKKRGGAGACCGLALLGSRITGRASCRRNDGVPGAC